MVPCGQRLWNLEDRNLARLLCQKVKRPRRNRGFALTLTLSHAHALTSSVPVIRA